MTELHVARWRDQHPDAASEATWALALRAESVGREYRTRLSDSRPWTTGTQNRAERILLSLSRILDGDEARLARAIRIQSVPWFVDADPLRSTLRRLSELTPLADEIIKVTSQSADLCARIDSLRLEFRQRAPSAWQDWFERSGITCEAASGALSLDELRALDDRLGLAESRIRRWAAELDEWHSETGNRPSDGEASGRMGAESRYELVLRLARLDRSGDQLLITGALRAGITKQVETLAARAQSPMNDAAFNLLLSYSRLTSRGLTADEIWTQLCCARQYAAAVFFRRTQ